MRNRPQKTCKRGKRTGLMRLLFLLLLLSHNGQASPLSAHNKRPARQAENSAMLLAITANEHTIIFQLNQSQAAHDLYAQLPLTLDVEQYGQNEKIFYPPKKLNTAATPKANAQAGTLAYYAPWGNVVLFYAPFGTASGLYELGQVLSGGEHIEHMRGTIQIKRGRH